MSDVVLNVLLSIIVILMDPKKAALVPLTETQMCQQAAEDRAAIDFTRKVTCETFNSALKMVENFYR